MLSALALVLAVDPANISHHDGQCITTGGANTSITVHFAAVWAPERHTFTWGPLPPTGKAYAFALNSALAVLPAPCVQKAGLASNAGNGDSAGRSLWIGRVDEPGFPAFLDLATCGCGAAIFACGSGGCTGDNVRQMRALAAQGFTVISPDSMSSPEAQGYPRYRPPVANLSQSVGQNQCVIKGSVHACDDSYWCGNLLYTDGCKDACKGGRSGCFSSNADHIAYDPAGWAAFYERVYSMRARELDYTVAHFASRFGTPPRLVLAGVSEGGMVVSRYSHPELPKLNLVARLVTEWSCALHPVPRPHHTEPTPPAPLPLTQRRARPLRRVQLLRLVRCARCDRRARCASPQPALCRGHVLRLGRRVSRGLERSDDNGRAVRVRLHQEERVRALGGIGRQPAPERLRRLAAQRLVRGWQPGSNLALLLMPPLWLLPRLLQLDLVYRIASPLCDPQAQMVGQGLTGVSLTLNEPFHGGYPYMAAFINYLIAHFLQAPAEFAKGSSILTHDGQPVTNSLCESLTSIGSPTHPVLSGQLCKGFEEFIAPANPKGYHDTAEGCAYDDQLVRPFLLSAPEPPACARVTVPPQVPMNRLQADHAKPPPLVDWCPYHGFKTGGATPLPTKACDAQRQGKCGACYAFSVTEQLSARILINVVKDSVMPPSVLSAEVPIALFAKDSDGELHGCGGGQKGKLVDMIKAGRGVPSNACAPALSRTLDCYNTKGGKTGAGWPRDYAEDGCTNVTRRGPSTIVEGQCYGNSSTTKWIRWGARQIVGKKVLNGEQAMMDEIRKNGPISASHAVYDNWRTFFKNPSKWVQTSGIYTYENGTKHKGHAILIVGYGTLKTPSGLIKYWKIRNSHGPDKGEQGYYRMLRGKNLSGIESGALSITVSTSSGDYVSGFDENESTNAVATEEPDCEWGEVPVDSPSAHAALRAAKMAKMGPSVVVTRALTQVVEGLNVHLELLLTSNVTKAGNMREAVVHTHEPDVGEEHEVISIAFADTKARYPWSR